MRIQTRFCCAPAAIDRPVIPLLAIAVAGLILTCPSTFARGGTQQVLIEPRIVEITRDPMRDLGIDQRIANVLSTLPANASQLSSPQATSFGLGASPSTSVIGQRLFPEDGAAGTIKVSGILTGPQYEAIQALLLHNKKAKALAQPDITVPNSQTANIHITPSTELPNGPLILDVTPSIGSDGKSINLLISLKDRSPAASPITVGLGEVPVLSGILSNTHKVKRNLIIFIAARIIDPGAGTEYDVTTDDNGYSDGEVNYEQPKRAKVEAIGTGETVGHVADFKLQNLTNGSLVFVIPPLILESRTGRNQDYVCPDQEKVAIGPGETKTVPVDGVCINRDKLPVGKDVSEALAINTGDSDGRQRSDRHIPAQQVGDLLRICRSIYEAVDQLQKDGSLKGFPYDDKEEQEEILEQWCVWTNPRICEIAKTPPATKDDMKKVVYKQVEEKGTPSRGTKRKIDKGIDTIFEKVELTTEKAKDLEKSDSAAQTKSPEQTEGQ